MVSLEELYPVRSNSSSPSKASQSVSSSPASTLTPTSSPTSPARTRAFTADEPTAIRTKNVSKEVEDWEVPNNSIKLFKKTIGIGSFGTVHRGYWHVPVAIKTLNVFNPCQEQSQAFKNEVDLLKKTRLYRNY